MHGWKLTAFGVAVVMATALVTGLILVSWTDGHRGSRQHTVPRPAPARVASNPTIAGPAHVDTGNRYAVSETDIVAGDARYRVAYASGVQARGFAA